MSKKSFVSMMGVLAAGLWAVLAVPNAQAQLVWTGSVANAAWDTSTPNWSNGTANALYADGSNVVFNDSAVATTVNIALPVSPGLILITNNTKTFIFTNNIIQGNSSLVKDGSGNVQVGASGATNLYAYNNSHTFTGGTTVAHGSLYYYVANTNDSARATGGTPFGFGTGAITLGATNSTFGFSGWKGSSLLTNNIEVLGGGTLDLSRYSSTVSPQNNFSGNLAIRSTNLLTITAAYAFTGDKEGRILGGVTTLYTNGTMKLINPSYQTRAFTYEQNITATDPSYGLTLTPQGPAPIEISGTNTGLVGGITLVPSKVTDANPVTAPVVFLNSNALSSVVNVSGGTFAGLQFIIDAGAMGKLNLTNGSALGIESNTAVNLDLSAAGINRDVWLGSVRGAIYSGNLTPYANSYHFGGGGSPDMMANNYVLVIANTNALTGARDLQIGDTNSLLQPGYFALAASNSFTGGISLNTVRCTGSTASAAPILASRAVGALGTGPVTINRGATINPILQFDTVPNSNIIPNDIVITGALGHATIKAQVPTWLTGNLTVYGTNGMAGGTNQLSLNPVSGGSLLVLNPAAGKAVTIATNNNVSFSVGLLDVVSIANMPPSVGLNIDLSGVLVLSSGFTWSNLVTGRTYSNNSRLPGGAWKGLNFAARGTPQVIDASGAFNAGYTNSWLLNGIGQSTPLQLGSVITNADGSFYANAPVKIARDITLSGVFWLGPATTGPGLTNASDFGVVNELAGTISGSGAPTLSGRGGTANAGQVAELVLSGSSIWTNGINMGYGNRFLSGPGGMGIAGSGPTGFIRFNGNASLPSGNAGVNAYIFAGASAGSYNNVNGLYGYLLTGSNGADQVYSLTNGMRFVLGGATSNTVGTSVGTFGAAYGKTTLTNSMISIFNDYYSYQVLNLLVRDSNGVFTLGSAAGPTRFSSCYSMGGSSGAGNWAPTNSPAEPMVDRWAPNTLIKRGPGVLVLSNVTYELFAGGGNIATNFSWQLGSGTTNLDDGVVRETGTSTNNSMRTQYIAFNGGSMGLVADFIGQIGTNNTQINMAGAAGGGFAAYGASRTVTLIPSGSTNTLGWGMTTVTAPDFFMNAVAPMILNAKDADASVVLTSSSTNAIKLMTANNNYTIKVMDNPLTSMDQAVMAIRLTSVTNLAGASFTKNGPGTLVLTATNNDYQAATFVSNGTLIVNGNLLSNRVVTASNVTVCSGATLSGTGTIARTVMVLSGGTLTAGAGNDQPGTLTVSNLMLSATGTLVVDVSASGVDKVVVGGGAVALTGALLVVPAAGYDMTGGANVTIMTAASFSGEFTSVPRGYTVRIEGSNLILHKDSPGFIFRIQ